MIAMQYNIKLPADYDMDIIKNRVKTNGHKTDGFLGLGMKAYLIAEKDKYNNRENQYAPFYLWNSPDGMNKFLLEGYFNNIITSFGWTEVDSWMVLNADVEKAQQGLYAMVERFAIPPHSNFEDLCGNVEENFAAWMADESTKAYITAYSPKSWELCRVHLTTDLDILQKLSCGRQLIFDVHHISK